MRLFDRFKRKKQPRVSLPQLCYDVAYFVLPHYAFERFEKLAELCLHTPEAAGPFFYLMACKGRDAEPEMEHAKQFRFHHGSFDNRREFFVLEYPDPPPVDLSGMSREQLIDGDDEVVLAPYYSAVIHEPSVDSNNYFILGQAPLGGGTTLRRIEPGGLNANLGPGPAPQLDLFVAAVRARLAV